MENPHTELDRLKIELQTRQLDPLNLRDHDPEGYDEETERLEARSQS